MQSHHNLFTEHVRANATLAFIKADPNFTTDRSRINACAAKQDATVLMPNPNDPYTIDVFKRVIHGYSNPMTGNCTLIPEDKTFQLKVKSNGKIEVYNADGTLSDKSADDFLYNQKARTLIAHLKATDIYKPAPHTNSDKVLFLRNHLLPDDDSSRKLIGIEIYPGGGYWYDIKSEADFWGKRFQSFEHSPKDCNDLVAEAYHEMVIERLTSDHSLETPALR